MALYGVALNCGLTAWNTENNSGEPGDEGNFTLRWIKDGVESTLNTTANELHATRCPGSYEILVNTTLTACNSGFIAGNSSTTNVVIIPMGMITFHRLPNVEQGESGGVALVSNIPTVSEVNTGVWGHATRTLSSASGITNTGEQIRLDGADHARVNTTGITTATGSDVNTGVWGHATRVLTGPDNITNTDQAVRLDGADHMMVNTTGISSHAAADIWDIDATGHQSGGTFGLTLGDCQADDTSLYARVYANLDVGVSSRSSHAASAIWSVATRELTSAKNITNTDAKIRVDRSDHVHVNTTGIITADLSTLEGRLTAARAGYLDKLNIGASNTLWARQTTIDGQTFERIMKMVLAEAAGKTAVDTDDHIVSVYLQDGETVSHTRQYTQTAGTDAAPRAINATTIP